MSHRADETFPAASTIKVPILLAVLREVDRGRLSLDQRVRTPEGERVGGSGDLVAVFDALAGGHLLSARGTTFGLGILRRQQLTNRLPALLPPDVTVAHKTGEVTGVCHDAGLIEAGGRRVAVAVLSDGLGPQAAHAALVIARIGRAVYDTLLVGG